MNDINSKNISQIQSDDLTVAEKDQKNRMRNVNATSSLTDNIDEAIRYEDNDSPAREKDDLDKAMVIPKKVENQYIPDETKH